MQKYEFTLYSIDEQKRWVSVNSMIAALNACNQGKEYDRNQKEFLAAVEFAHVVQIWMGRSLQIAYVNENESVYRGIDFFMKPQTEEPEKGWGVQAFQLVEYHEKYSGSKSFNELVEWIKEKKYSKGDKKVNLVVLMKTSTGIAIPIDAVQKVFGESPFKSIILLGSAKKMASHSYKYLIQLDSDNSRTVVKVNWSMSKLHSFDRKCVWFDM